MWFGSYQHIVEKYSVNCILMTSDGIGYYIFLFKVALFCYYVLRGACALSNILIVVEAIDSI
jgi:hypothetical protein